MIFNELWSSLFLAAFLICTAGIKGAAGEAPAGTVGEVAGNGRKERPPEALLRQVGAS